MVDVMRRNLVVVLVVVGLAVVAVSAVLFLDGNGGASDRVTVDTPVGSGPERVMVEVDGVDEAVPFFLVRDDAGAVLALVGRDPHSGCSVDWLADYDAASLGEPGPGAFKANCSGWVFSRDGRALFGASPRGLDRVAVTVKNGGKQAELDLSHFILGPCRDDAQPDCSPDGTPQLVTTLPLPIVRPRP